jgi:hypothetical protein
LILLRTVYQSTLSNVCFWYGTVDGERIKLLAKLAAAAPFAKIANFANNRCKSSLTPPMVHRQRAENEDIFAIFANWVMTLDPSPAAQTSSLTHVHPPPCKTTPITYFAITTLDHEIEVTWGLADVIYCP